MLTDAVHTLLALLQDYGLVLQPHVAPRPQCHDFDTLLAHLRASIGAHIVDAALAAGRDAPLSGEPAPAAVMPVWAFTPEGDDSGNQDVLLGSCRLRGTDLLIEALRVESEEQPAPVPTVRSRFDRWIKAGGRGIAPLCPAATAAASCSPPPRWSEPPTTGRAVPRRGRGQNGGIAWDTTLGEHTECRLLARKALALKEKPGAPGTMKLRTGDW